MWCFDDAKRVTRQQNITQHKFELSTIIHMYKEHFQPRAFSVSFIVSSIYTFPGVLEYNGVNSKQSEAIPMAYRSKLYIIGKLIFSSFGSSLNFLSSTNG